MARKANFRKSSSLIMAQNSFEPLNRENLDTQGSSMLGLTIIDQIFVRESLLNRKKKKRS